MKKRELLRRLRSIARSADVELNFTREGANHEIWTIDGERLVIPRHRDVNERTAYSIIRRAKEVTTDEN